MCALTLWSCAPERIATSRLGSAQFEGRYIDAHMHVHAHYRAAGGIGWDMDAAAKAALAGLDRSGAIGAVIMPPPFPPGRETAYDFEILSDAVRAHPDRFAFLGGGGLLNPMIHSARDIRAVAPDLRQTFEQRAQAILHAGAKGFGEMAALHFSLRRNHPFEEVSPDHPLLLLLADIAAGANVPIDLHMEAVVSDWQVPDRLRARGPDNPLMVHENIAAFERLLAHNRGARIIWAHAGWDNTGHRTVALMRRLLTAHPNLHMSIKVRRSRGPGRTPLDRNGNLRPEWLALLEAFPDRFLMASDQHYYVPGEGRQREADGPARRFFSQLPPQLAGRIGDDNVKRMFGLGRPRL